MPRLGLFFIFLTSVTFAMVPRGKIPPLDPKPSPPLWWGPDPTESLDLPGLAGTLLMADLMGSALDEAQRGFLNRVRPGFLLLFEYNLVPGPGGPPLLESLIAEVNAHCTSQGFRPPVWAVDEEGGPISRLGPRQGFPEYPPPRRVAQWGDEDAARKIWGHMADTLREAGIAVNLAPSLDLSRWQSAPLLGLRTFGGDAQTVSRWGRLFCETMARHGIAPVAKHLPGHGAATSDSHRELPRVLLGEQEWLDEHLRPFSDSVRWGVDGIMVAHLWVPYFDPTPGLPASLSRAMAQTVVRDQLKYDGLLFTDSLAMGAITNDRAMGRACEDAIRAGMDVLLIPDSLEKVEGIHRYLVSRLAEDPSLRSRARESARRILLWRNLRERRLAHFIPPPKTPIQESLGDLNRRTLLACSRELEEHMRRGAVLDLRQVSCPSRAPIPPDGGSLLLRLPNLPGPRVTRLQIETLARQGPVRALTAGDPSAWEDLGLRAITSSCGLPLGE